MFAKHAHQCISAEAIGDVLERAADDPVRLQAEDCPRCRTLIRSYAQFVNAEDVADSGLAQARGRLDAWIASGPGGRSVAASRPSFRTTLGAFVTSWLRPARLLPVAALVVALAVFLWNRNPEVAMLRAPVSETVSTRFEVLAPESGAGSVRLSWRAHPQADAYEVVFYSPTLDEVFRSTSPETTLVLDRQQLPASIVSGSPLTYRVRALHLGDPVETTDPGSVDAP